MASKIEDIIDEIESFIDECKPATFSASKIIVNKDELESLLSDLRTKTPEEIRKYQRMLAQREQIIADARARADEIINAAQIQTNELVSEHQIMQQAYAQANEVIQIAERTAKERLNKATEEANQIRMGAIAYTDELLANIETILSNSIETTRSRNDNFLLTMGAYLKTVEENRAALAPDQIFDNPSEDQSTPAAEVKETTVETNQQEAVSTTDNADQDDLPALDIPDQFFNKE